MLWYLDATRAKRVVRARVNFILRLEKISRVQVAEYENGILED